MPDPRRARRRPVDRSELPATFTPETLRDLDFATARVLARPGNGVLTAEEQKEFDAAFREVMRDPTGRLQQSLRRFGRDRAEHLDPELRRSYLRSRARLEAQAERARTSFPQLSSDLGETPSAPEVAPGPEDGSARDDEERDEASDDMSLASFQSEIEETSDSLVLLERIASLEQEQLEHHRAQALRDVRGVFFALVVSVAVIVAGVAPLVGAEPHDRVLILLWTAVVCLVAGLVYAVVRAVQSRRVDSG